MAYLFTESDLNETLCYPPSGYIPMAPEIVDQVDQYHQNAATEDGYWIIVSRPENLIKIIIFFITQIVYLAVFHLTTVFFFKKSAFFALTALFSWEIGLRTLYFLSVQFLSLIVPSVWLYGILTGSSMVFDIFGHFFRHPMVLLMAVNRVAVIKYSHRFDIDKAFTR